MRKSTRQAAKRAAKARLSGGISSESPKNKKIVFGNDDDVDAPIDENYIQHDKEDEVNVDGSAASEGVGINNDVTTGIPEVGEDDLKAIAEISHHTRTQSMSENGKLTSMVSTRASVEMAGLIYDGFELSEAAEISIYPFFSQDGGVDSERTYIKQLVQKYQQDENGEPLFKEVDDTESNEDDIPQF